MWYWNPIDCNEALPGIHDLERCVVMDNDNHPFKMEQLPDGKVWGNDENNHPILNDIPSPTTEDLEEVAELQKAQLKAIADSEIEWRQDAVDAGIATDDETVVLADWKKYRVLLMRVDTADPEWPTPPTE